MEAQPWDDLLSYGCGVDWVTCTYHRDTDIHKINLAAVLGLLRGFCQGGGVGYKMRSFGAHGYSGLGIGGAKWARRDDSTMLILSGWSGGLFQQLPEIDEATCTRIDIRGDFKWPEDKVPRLAHWAYQQSQAYKKEAGAGRPWKCSIIVGDSGCTTYLGSRQSAMYIRVYDKHAESGKDEYKGVWRIEAEFHDEAANDIFHRLRVQPDLDGAASGVLAANIARRGLFVPITRDDKWRPQDFYREGVTDNNKSLEWLKTQVAPTIRRLLREGLEDDILFALGLQKRSTANGNPTTYPHGRANDLGSDG